LRLAIFFPGGTALHSEAAGFLPVGDIEYCQVRIDARFNFFHPWLRFGTGEILVAVVDYPKFAVIESDQI
jgi:hypothetical protein